MFNEMKSTTKWETYEIETWSRSNYGHSLFIENISEYAQSFKTTNSSFTYLLSKYGLDAQNRAICENRMRESTEKLEEKLPEKELWKYRIDPNLLQKTTSEGENGQRDGSFVQEEVK